MLLWLSTECDARTFGPNCAETCGNCAGNEQCHHVNATCLNGCNPGFQGLNCTEGNLQSNTVVCMFCIMNLKVSLFLILTVCTNGFYGFSCLKVCSRQCGIPGRCDRESGECLDGCQTGWKKPTCETSNTVYAKYLLRLFWCIFTSSTHFQSFNVDELR